MNRDLIGDLEALTSRFLGVDIQRRRDRGGQSGSAAVFWGGQWRACLVTSKNERSEYRLTVYGHSFEQAATRLLEAVQGVDHAMKMRHAARVWANRDDGGSP